MSKLARMAPSLVLAGSLIHCFGPTRIAQPLDKRENQYFGHIQAACAEDDCRRLKANLEGLDNCTCHDCEAARELRHQLFGRNTHPELPDFIVYFEQKTDGKFIAHRPVLSWKNTITPYLYGARDVYVDVLTEHQACLKADISTDFKDEPNPMSTLLAAIGTKVEASTAGPKDSKHIPGKFTWYPLSGDYENPRMWLATARFSLDENSMSRITVAFSPREKASGNKKGDGEQPDECALPEDLDAARTKKVETKATYKRQGDEEILSITAERKADSGGGKEEVEVTAEDKAAPGKGAKKPSGNFLAANGFFSNSPAGHAALSLSLGASFGGGGKFRGTSISSGGSEVAFNGYAMVKFYVFRPRLLPGPKDRWWRRDRVPSLSVFGGTGVKSPLDEFVFGLSAGHLLGNAGLVLGGNSIAAAKDSTGGRKTAPFIGIDYSL